MTASRVRRSGGVLIALVLLPIATPGRAWARTMEIVSYPITEVWPAAVRLMRVDRNFPIKEKDESAGYILFQYTDGPTPCKGSLELIPTTDPEGRDATRVVISIPDLPSQYERMLIDRFMVKLREDDGRPPPPPTKPRPPRRAKPDAGPQPGSPTPAP